MRIDQLGILGWEFPGQATGKKLWKNAETGGLVSKQKKKFPTNSRKFIFCGFYG